MAVQWIMANGETVPCPQDVTSQGPAAEQSFYDNQAERVRMELEAATEEAGQ